MTLVISAHGRNFVILGADSRGTIGTEEESLIIGMDDQSKITQVTPHVGFLIFGLGNVADMLLVEFDRGDLDGVSLVKERFRAHCRRKWNEWLQGVRPESLPAFGFLITGLDPNQGEYVNPNTYSLFSESGFVPGYHRKFVCMGCPMLANYILNKRYREDMTIETLSPLVAYAISETASVDRRVGGHIKIAIIDGSGYRLIPEDTVGGWLEDFE
jgi:20S proteasome alpha/beta subunit